MSSHTSVFADECVVKPAATQGSRGNLMMMHFLDQCPYFWPRWFVHWSLKSLKLLVSKLNFSSDRMQKVATDQSQF